MSKPFPEDLLRFLKRPDSYPHQPEQVKHIQTHISHVFIAAPYVYKFKKPVQFDFLDFGTLEKRQFYCQQEVELNRRLCSGPYLGVVPLYNDGDSWSFESEDNQPPGEYAVWMDQLSDEHFLKSIVERGELTRVHLDRVIDHLINFYKNQTPDREVIKWATPQQVTDNSNDNFEQTRPFLGDTLDPVVFRVLETVTNDFLDRNRPLFEKRIRDGHVLDTHGDLRLDHIHITDERVCIYDCIEFSQKLRCQDVVADIAFLAMDLDFNGQQAESRYLSDELSARRSDPDMPGLIDYYKSYRAYIRGKVNSLTSRDEEVPTEDRRRASERAVRYFALSLYYMLFGSRSMVVVVMGPVASGKSTLARELSRRLNGVHLSSDVVRKQKAGLTVEERTPDDRRDELYTTRVTEMTYRQLRQTALNEARVGSPVILDATFGDPYQRRQLTDALRDSTLSWIFIEATAPDTVRRERLSQRESNGRVISDAREEDMEMLDRAYQPPGKEEGLSLVKTDTSGAPETTVDHLLHQLAGQKTDRR